VIILIFLEQWLIRVIYINRTNNGQDLLMSVSKPLIEFSTVGGGTILTPQGSVLDILGTKGQHPSNPGENAQRLVRIIATAVMTGGLSLKSALAAGHFVRACYELVNLNLSYK
jgi:hydroxymethylglutaryl-CoA reductase (NADPH)